MEKWSIGIPTIVLVLVPDPSTVVTSPRPNTRHSYSFAQPISNGPPYLEGPTALIRLVPLEGVLPITRTLLFTFASSILRQSYTRDSTCCPQ
jgi:hypothetical protein